MVGAREQCPNFSHQFSLTISSPFPDENRDIDIEFRCESLGESRISMPSSPHFTMQHFDYPRVAPVERGFSEPERTKSDSKYCLLDNVPLALVAFHPLL